MNHILYTDPTGMRILADSQVSLPADNSESPRSGSSPLSPATGRRRYRAVLRRAVAVVVMGLLVKVALAQQDPMYTQYNFNTQLINPAYAGSWDRMGFVALGRHQWVGMTGAPQTYTLSLQSPVKNNGVALGLNVVSDKVGLENRLMISGDYSYRLKLSEETFLRLGLKGGLTNYMNNLSQYTGYPGETPDPMFQGEVDVRFMPNFGVGAFMYSEKYYLGLSLPRILQNEFRNNYNNYSTFASMRHLFLQGGYVFELSQDVKFKPTMLVKAVWGAPVEADLTGNFLLRDKVWLGAMLRTFDSYGFIAQWIFDRQLRFGYSIDFTTTRLRNHHSGTHEVMVSYEIGTPRRKWSTPRMF
jgi:type IX secretion system PorP/SprF family membrane protein